MADSESTGVILGQTASRQIGEMVRWWQRDHANDKPDRNSTPRGDATIIRCGILQSDLIGQTTTPVLANEQQFMRNTSTSGSAGTWATVVDPNNSPVQLKVIDFLLPTTKKIQAGKKVVCVHIAADVCIVIAAECPVNV